MPDRLPLSASLAIVAAGSALTWGGIWLAFGPQAVLAAVVGIVGVSLAVAVAEELASVGGGAE